MNLRVLGCGANLLVSAAVATGAAYAVGGVLPPTVPGLVLAFPAVFGFFISMIVLTALQTALFPHANLIRAREIERALRDAPARTVAQATVGSYARVTGVLEAVAHELVGPLTGRPCVAYRLGRRARTHGRHDHAQWKHRQLGTRARLSDTSGSIEIDLLGLMPSATGDALPDSLIATATAAMGERARLAPKIEFPSASEACLGGGGTSGAWPDGASAPSNEDLAALSARDFDGSQGTALWEEEILAVGVRVEAVGIVAEEGGRKVITAPANAQILVRSPR